MENMMPTKKSPSKKRALLEWAGTILVALIIAFTIRTFVFSLFFVDGNSMNNTLIHNEVMFSTKYDYLLNDPARFDVVICRYPGRKENFVKRVVGIPGDTIAVRDGYLYVNAEQVQEAYITHRPNYEISDYTVGEGEYFVLGDNRANSNDSHVIGPIKREAIVAHVRSVLFPLDKIGAVA